MNLSSQFIVKAITQLLLTAGFRDFMNGKPVISANHFERPSCNQFNMESYSQYKPKSFFIFWNVPKTA